MKRRIGLAIMCLAFAGGVASASPSSALACEANTICTYWGNTYNNWALSFQCSSSGKFDLGGVAFSATNRCGNKTNWLKTNGSVVACMNPGGNRPHPGAYNEGFIAAEYGAFC
jgi:hypothetical protein